MRKFLFIAIILFPMISFSQEKDNYKEASKQFMLHFNAADYEAIFNMFDDGMKSSLPKEQAVPFLEDMASRLGKIKTMSFSNTKQTAHNYKTTFDEGFQDILIYLNSENEVGGLFVLPHKPAELPKLNRNTTKMFLPFNDEWYVFWGGVTQDDNYHVAYENQSGAYDFIMMKDGKNHEGTGTINEDYYAFGKEIIAPCDAKVVKVISGLRDNNPGRMNPNNPTGNTVILETKNKEFIVLAHFKAKSIVVKEGQEIKQEEVLGLCGNSGNSSEPHVHLSLQNVLDLDIATGAKLYFEEILVNGEVKEDYLPL
ncbi:peptidoglycan DD-metalloendopeptidase family protein, partial [Oceanihabitans sp.]|nr:peptidoglycan DD-metalloendopeptidase family protein [Oceanihabitans sp.]